MEATRKRVPMLTQLRSNGQITLPSDVRRGAKLAEGDYVEVSVVKAGILLRPKKLIDADQAWFWTPEWQEGEREATENIRTGRVSTYKEMTWAGDGLATFEFGQPVRPNEPHIIWRRCGDHSIFREP